MHSLRRLRLSKKGVLALIGGSLLVAASIIVLHNPHHASPATPAHQTYSRSASSVAADPTGTTAQANTQKQRQSYSVPPDRPQTLTITKLGIKADVTPLGITKDGDIAAPSDSNQAGWYTGSALPGRAGAVIIDGHTSSEDTHPALFNDLGTLAKGDIIQLTRGDGTVLNYVVVHTEIDTIQNVDMERFLQPYNGAQQGLNLITCAGERIGTGANRTLTKRVLVFSVPQQ